MDDVRYRIIVEVFQKVAERLHYDEFRTYDLFEKTEEMRRFIMEKYG